MELCLLVPSSMLIEDKIGSSWIFNAANKDKQIKQVKILLWLSIITNAILIVLNSYPFVVYYEGGVLVTLMTLCLYFANGCCVYISAKELKSINVRFEQNVNKFSKPHNTQGILNSADKPREQSNSNSEIICNNAKQIDKYLDKCKDRQISLDVIKAKLHIIR